MEQRQIFINNLAIRRASEELKVSSSYEQVCRILVAAFSNNDFDAFELRLLRLPAELLQSQGLQIVSSAEPQFRWKKPGSHVGHEMLAAWSMTLDLLAANNRRRGSLTIYRKYNQRDLQLDVNLLTCIFPGALADALERALEEPAAAIASDDTSLIAAQAG
jgi:hypothetical protein